MIPKAIFDIVYLISGCKSHSFKSAKPCMPMSQRKAAKNNRQNSYTSYLSHVVKQHVSDCVYTVKPQKSTSKPSYNTLVHILYNVHWMALACVFSYKKLCRLATKLLCVMYSALRYVFACTITDSHTIDYYYYFFCTVMLWSFFAS